MSKKPGSPATEKSGYFRQKQIDLGSQELGEIKKRWPDLFLDTLTGDDPSACRAIILIDQRRTALGQKPLSRSCLEILGDKRSMAAVRQERQPSPTPFTLTRIFRRR